MKATELQIGDFVYANVYIYDPNHIPEIIPNPVKVTEIGTNVVVEYIFKNTIRNYILPLDRLIPIQLTAEILEKNGFKAPIFNSILNPERLQFALPTNEFIPSKFITRNLSDNFFMMNDFIQIRYVHELQHALRLCGLDELADNLKT